MKLLWCPDCHDTITIGVNNIVRKCMCGRTAAKYLEDNITAIVTEGSIVFGIDNTSLTNAIKNAKYWMPNKFDRKRLDFFFTGWVPTKPGEVVFVDTVEDVIAYNYHEKLSFTSENPSTDISEKENLEKPEKKFKWYHFLTSGLSRRK